jgi:Chitobiase/beta-hexosaminidase C-terminal domain
MYGSNARANGYGIDWAASTSDSLALNNISQHIAAAYITEHAIGDVFAYNYAADDFFGSNWQACDQTEHDEGDYDLLWEGNVGICVTDDDIHGSTLFNTYYREYLSGFDPSTEVGPKLQDTSAFMNMAYSRYSNVVGSVLGTQGYHDTYENVGLGGNPDNCPGFNQTSIYRLGFGDQNQIPYSPTCFGTSFTIDNDDLVAATLMRWGNYDVVTGEVKLRFDETASKAPVYPGLRFPSIFFPPSFFLKSRPSWWLFPNGTRAPWPGIGPDVREGNIVGTDGHAWLNPAANCYLNVMGGKVDGSSGPLLNFTADTCYGHVPEAATPAITPETGAYGSAQTVAIGDATPGATIHYTTDGSTPTATSTVYVQPFTVSSTTTVNAIATADSATQSAVGSAFITIGSMTLVQHLWFEVSCRPICGAVPIKPTGEGNLLFLSAEDTGPGDGTTANISSVSCSPNCGAWVLPGAVCQAVSGYAGGVDCAYVLASEPDATQITVTMTGSSPNEVLHFREYHSTVGPAFRFDAAAAGTPASGTCFICVTPSLSLTGTNDVVIAGGTPGSVFTSVNPPYGDVQIDSEGTAVGDVLNTTSGAGATLTQSNTRGDLAAYYTIAFTDGGAPSAAAPVFSPGAGTYNHPLKVTIGDQTKGAQIFYTTDGTTPTTSSTLYSGPIIVTHSLTFRAIAVVDGDANSAVVTAAYTIRGPHCDDGGPCGQLDASN